MCLPGRSVLALRARVRPGGPPVRGDAVGGQVGGSRAQGEGGLGQPPSRNDKSPYCLLQFGVREKQLQLSSCPAAWSQPAPAAARQQAAPAAAAAQTPRAACAHRRSPRGGTACTAALTAAVSFWRCFMCGASVRAAVLGPAVASPAITAYEHTRPPTQICGAAARGP